MRAGHRQQETGKGILSGDKGNDKSEQIHRTSKSFARIRLQRSWCEPAEGTKQTRRKPREDGKMVANGSRKGSEIPPSASEIRTIFQNRENLSLNLTIGLLKLRIRMVMESCPRGRRSTPAKRVYPIRVSGVQIPSSPPRVFFYFRRLFQTAFKAKKSGALCSSFA